MIPGLFLNLLTNLFCHPSGLLPDLCKVVTHLDDLYLSTVVWTDDLEICSCLEIAPRDLPSLYKSAIIVESKNSSVDFCLTYITYFEPNSTDIKSLSRQRHLSRNFILKWHQIQHSVTDFTVYYKLHQFVFSTQILHIKGQYCSCFGPEYWRCSCHAQPRECPTCPASIYWEFWEWCWWQSAGSCVHGRWVLCRIVTETFQSSSQPTHLMDRASKCVTLTAGTTWWL